MGQKVHPYGLRVGVIKDWDSKWYSNKKEFGDLLVEDHEIREFIKNKLFASGISRVEIERAAAKIKVNIYTAKPGIIIGKAGAGIEEIRKEVSKLIKSNKEEKQLSINIIEIKSPDTDAQLVSENIAAQLEKRVSFRKAMKQAMGRAIKFGVKGIKTSVSGRLGGAEMARTEHYHQGTIPLQTIRADVDYGFAEANTTYGKLGVKVWIYKGEVLPQSKKPVITEGGE